MYVCIRACMHASREVCIWVYKLYEYIKWCAFSTIHLLTPSVALASHHMVQMKCSRRKEFWSKLDHNTTQPRLELCFTVKDKRFETLVVFEPPENCCAFAPFFNQSKTTWQKFSLGDHMMKRRTPCTCGMRFRAHASITWTSSCQRLLVWRRVQ